MGVQRASSFAAECRQNHLVLLDQANEFLNLSPSNGLR
jgi:hypothetical protein